MPVLLSTTLEVKDVFAVLRLIRSLRLQSNATQRGYFRNWLRETMLWGYTERDTLRERQRQTTLTRRDFAALMNAYLLGPTSQRKSEFRWTTVCEREHCQPVEVCSRCLHLDWGHHFRLVANHPGEEQVRLCSACISTRYMACGQCGVLYLSPRQMNSIDSINYWASHNEIYFCLPCYRAQFITCHSCGRIYRHTELHAEPHVHPTALFCRRCYPPDRSACHPTHPDFIFPAFCTEQKSIKAEETVLVTVGGGDVSEAGMVGLRNKIQEATRLRDVDTGIILNEILDPDFSRDWQDKDGNMPKRIAKILLLRRHMKLTDELMAELGNIARQFVSKPGQYRVGFTRNVNQRRELFGNDNSCWWTNYWYSRCTFKSMGGIGARTFNESGQVTSRAWMVPLNVVLDLLGNPIVTTTRSAPEVATPAYVLFNAYGVLDLWQYGRLIAQMTGKSYRKVSIRVANERMYVNNGSGLLVAEQSVCSAISAFNLAVPTGTKCGCY